MENEMEATFLDIVIFMLGSSFHRGYPSGPSVSFLFSPGQTNNGYFFPCTGLSGLQQAPWGSVGPLESCEKHQALREYAGAT